jgi:hypothetical protein
MENVCNIEKGEVVQEAVVELLSFCGVFL